MFLVELELDFYVAALLGLGLGLGLLLSLAFTTRHSIPFRDGVSVIVFFVNLNKQLPFWSIYEVSVVFDKLTAPHLTITISVGIVNVRVG